MTLRFARWCAVSTAEQARPGKFSIPAQLDRTKQAALEMGWVESAGPFIVEGASRTKYIQLDQASAEIEPLRLMLQAARDGQFDVLVMSEFDRLRELLDQVFRTLASYRVQLYSVAQPIEPKPPELYDIHEADTVAILIGISQITSRQEISRMRRKWSTGMPKRITELGLPAAHIPFGYRKPAGRETDRKAIPEPDPSLAPHITAIKDLLLAGKSISQLIDYLEDRHIAAPRGGMWHKQTVRDILKNPFYAGLVTWGKSRVYLDPITDRRKRNRRIPTDQIKQNKGKHAALWDEATLEAILHEFKRRTKSYRGRVNNQFTGLVKCGVCGAPMWRQENGPRGEHRLIWRCSSRANRQTPNAALCTNSIPHTALIEKVGAIMLASLKTYTQRQRQAETTHDEKKLIRRDLHELRLKQIRLEEAYLAGQWDLSRYTKRKAELDEQIAAAQNAVNFAERHEIERRAWLHSLTQMTKLHDLPTWLKTKDPAEINRALHLLLEKIVVNSEGVELKFK